MFLASNEEEPTVKRTYQQAGRRAALAVSSGLLRRRLQLHSTLLRLVLLHRTRRSLLLSLQTGIDQSLSALSHLGSLGY